MPPHRSKPSYFRAAPFVWICIALPPLSSLQTTLLSPPSGPPSHVCLSCVGKLPRAKLKREGPRCTLSTFLPNLKRASRASPRAPPRRRAAGNAVAPTASIF